MIRIFALAGVFLVLSISVRAAELPAPGHHRHAPAGHFGYYFGNYGWRSGGTPGSWQGSTFALLATPAGHVIHARSPKGVAAIHCPAARPLVCLAEPVVVPVGRR